MGHKGDKNCVHSSKVACEKARRIAIGQCASMLDEARQCPHWGIDTVEGAAYCGQHLSAVYLAADKARREKTRRDEMFARIDAALAWHAEHPSVWDTMPH
jgi:hypothetical protein